MNQAQPFPETNSDTLTIVPETGVAGGRATILLVEDEAFVREVTSEILESAGYRVLKTRNADEAKEVFGRYKNIIRLLLTDVVLPGRNGRDLSSDLRALKPGLLTIFISGYPENAVTKRGMPKDGAFYLPKPFSLQSLTRTVRQALQQEQ